MKPKIEVYDDYSSFHRIYIIKIPFTYLVSIKSKLKVKLLITYWVLKVLWNCGLSSKNIEKK